MLAMFTCLAHNNLLCCPATIACYLPALTDLSLHVHATHDMSLR